MSVKDTFKSVDHPDFEVHNFHTLAAKVGFSPTGLAHMYSQGRFQMIATNFESSKNCFAITKAEIERIKKLKSGESTSRYREEVPQEKVEINEPLPSEINKQIIALATKYGFLRQCITMYLHGQLNYRECLEQMVISMMNEHAAQGDLLMEITQENFELFKQLPQLTYEQPSMPTLPERSEA